MEHEVDGGTTCNRCARNDLQRLGRFGNRRRVEVGLNTEKSSRELGTLHSDSRKRLPVNTGAKNSQGV